MSSVFCHMVGKGLITPPKFIASNLQYETMTGSVSYGVSDDTSDLDIVGYCIPPKEEVFPHLAGHIDGFGKQKQAFGQFQQHHIMDKEARGGKGQEVDITIYNIVKYFQLCMQNNPNMVDSLFVPLRCIKHSTSVGNMVRENRKMFLHKGSYHKMKGYAYAQLHKMDNKKPQGKRLASVEKYGYDVKYAYHVVRLLDEAEQILEHHDLDLTRNREQLKAIRRGELTEADIRKHFESKEKQLEKLYVDSTLQHSPDVEAIKQLLLNCLEQHYGDLSSCVVNVDKSFAYLTQIKEIIEKSGV